MSKSFHAGPPWHRHRVDVLDQLSLDVRTGELVGLVGENGSGKSTLMQMVVGLLGRDAGTIDRKGRLGYCPQQPLLWDKLTVAEHFSLFGTAYGMSDGESKVAATSMMDELQFGRYEHYRVERLSGGRAKAQFIARSDARSVAPSARRAVLGVRLGDLSALLGDEPPPPRRGHGDPHRQPPPRRA